MWHQWFNRNFMKLREHFLWTKKTLFNNFFSSVSVFHAHSWECHDARVCIPLIENKAQCIRILHQNADSCVSSTKHMCRDTLVNAQQRLRREELLNKVIIFVCFVHKKYSRSFMKLRQKHWRHMDHFNNVLTTFLGLERVSCIAVYGGSECVFEDEQRSYRFGTTWGWVINDRIFIFGRTIPLNWLKMHYYANQMHHYF